MQRDAEHAEYTPTVLVTPAKIELLVMALVQDDLQGIQWTNEYGDSVSAFTFLVEALDCCQEALYKEAMQSGNPMTFQYEHASFYRAVSRGCDTAHALLEKKYPAPKKLLSSAWRRTIQ